MIGSILARVSRHIAFVGFNAGVLLLIALFLIAPLVERFSDRADAIAQDGADLARQEGLRAQAQFAVAGSSASDHHFLPGHDYATADADLQQILKTLAAQSGVRFVGVRGLGADPSHAAGLMVTARLDVEGSLGAIGALVQSIETHSPCLFIGALTMRGNVAEPRTSADDLNAQLSVLGAFERSPPAREDL